MEAVNCSFYSAHQLYVVLETTRILPIFKSPIYILNVEHKRITCTYSLDCGHQPFCVPLTFGVSIRVLISNAGVTGMSSASDGTTSAASDHRGFIRSIT